MNHEQVSDVVDLGSDLAQCGPIDGIYNSTEVSVWMNSSDKCVHFMKSMTCYAMKRQVY